MLIKPTHKVLPLLVGHLRANKCVAALNGLGANRLSVNDEVISRQSGLILVSHHVDTEVVDVETLDGGVRLAGANCLNGGGIIGNAIHVDRAVAHVAVEETDVHCALGLDDAAVGPNQRHVNSDGVLHNLAVLLDDVGNGVDNILTVHLVGANSRTLGKHALGCGHLDDNVANVGIALVGRAAHVSNNILRVEHLGFGGRCVLSSRIGRPLVANLGSILRRGFLALGQSLALNRARLDLHRQPIGDVLGGDGVFAVLVGGDRVALDAVDEGLDRGNLHALGGSSRELQFFVCGNVDRVGVVVNLVPVLGKGDGGAVSQNQLDGSKLILLDRRRRLRARIGRRLGLGAQNRVGRGVRGGGFGCRFGRRLDGLDHGLFGCLRAVGRRGLIRRPRRLIGHGGVCRLRSGGLHAGVIHRRGDILARLLVGQRAACECRRANHLRGEQDRQDDRRRLDAEIPPSSQDSTVGLHKTPPTFSAAISRGSSSPDRAAPCVPTWEPNFHSGIPARDVHSSAIRRRTPTRRVKIIASIFTTNTHPGFSAKNEFGEQRNECIPGRCYFLTFRNERGVSGHQCGNRAAAPRNECRRRGIDIPANGTSTSPLTGFRYFY